MFPDTTITQILQNISITDNNHFNTVRCINNFYVLHFFLVLGGGHGEGQKDVLKLTVIFSPEYKHTPFHLAAKLSLMSDTPKCNY